MTQDFLAQERELLELSRRLLDSIDNRDWSAYARLCSESLSAFEPEAAGHLVTGMDFHRFYFELEPPASPRRSTMTSPQVQLLGDAAVVSYVRLVQFVDSNGVPKTVAFAESRVWHRHDGRWLHVHFHRSTAAEQP